MPHFAAGLAALLLLAAPAPAWNGGGHMAIGAVAYEVLKRDDPATLARAVAVLKAHPQFEKLWRKGYDERPAGERDLYLFMMMGRWADDIRKSDYDRPTWHYTNYGQTPAGYRGPIAPGTPDPAGNVVLAYAENMAKLTAGPEDVDRAVPLCWVAHLVGDVHMPLHVTSLYSEQFPDGDRGGNRFFVKVGPRGRGVNLHYFWDGLVTGEQGFRQVRNVATELRLRPEFARDRLTELTEPSFENWAKVESATLARTVVRQNDTLQGGSGEFSAVELPAGYPKAVKPVAERRAVLAGYRLAASLRAALK